MLPKWARKLQIPRTGLESESGSSDPEHRLLVLPNPRPRPLTPPPASEDPPSTSVTTRDSGLFVRLPFELRRRILVEAFGAQTVHIDLVYGRPREEPRGASDEYHRLRRAPRPSKEERRSSPALHKLKPKRWRWYSCVCHSVLPFESDPWSRMNEPCNDACADTAHYCTLWPGKAPHKCHIGIMGWLLTCRQAYVEGIDVLWATNTFRIRDTVILRHAQQLFLPHRWASIPRLEIQWFFSPGDWTLPATTEAPASPARPYGQQTSFLDLMDRLPPVLRNLKTLHITLQSTSNRTFGAPGPHGLTELMKPVEGMLRRLPCTIRECTIAVPSSLYRPSRDDAKRDGRVVEHAHKKQRERHWRELSGPTEGLDGYWLQLGKTDFSPLAIIPTACFGTGADHRWREEVDIEKEDFILYGLHWE